MSKKFRAALDRLVETTANNNPRNARKARNNPRSRHNPVRLHGLVFEISADAAKYANFLDDGQDIAFEGRANYEAIPGLSFDTAQEVADFLAARGRPAPAPQAAAPAYVPVSAAPAYVPVSPTPQAPTPQALPPRPGTLPRSRSIPGVTPAVVRPAPQRPMTYQLTSPSDLAELMGSERNPVTLRQYRKFQRLFLYPNFEAMRKQNMQAGQTTRTPGPLTHEWLFKKGYINKEGVFVRPFYNLEMAILVVKGDKSLKDDKYAQKRTEKLDGAVALMLNLYAPQTMTTSGLRTTKDMSRLFQYLSQQPGVADWGNLMIPVNIPRRCPYCRGSACEFCGNSGYVPAPNSLLEVPGTIYYPSRGRAGAVGYAKWEPYAYQEEGPDGQPLERWHRDDNGMMQAVNLTWDALVAYGFRPPEGQWAEKELSPAERQKLSDLRRAANSSEEEETAVIQQEVGN